MAYPPELSRNALAKIRSNRSDSNDHNIIDTIYNDGVGGDRDDAYQRLCFNVDDFQALAKKRLRKDLYEYLASGSDDEQTLSENRLAFKRWFLRPRVLRSVGRIRTQTVLRFGRRGSSNGWCSHPVAMPVFVSPAGVHALCDERHGECATARACSKASILFGLSQHSTRSIELIRRAISAGYKGIFLTVDSVRFGYREADARNGFNALPPPHRLVNYDEPPSSEATAAAAALEKSSRRSSSLGLDQTYNSQEKKAWDQNSEQMFEQDVSWEDVRWIKNELVKRQQTNKGPLVPSSSRAS
jgi:(S)-2-hydroxy-acid oxidase